MCFKISHPNQHKEDPFAKLKSFYEKESSKFERPILEDAEEFEQKTKKEVEDIEELTLTKDTETISSVKPKRELKYDSYVDEPQEEEESFYTPSFANKSPTNSQSHENLLEESQVPRNPQKIDTKSQTFESKLQPVEAELEPMEAVSQTESKEIALIAPTNDWQNSSEKVNLPNEAMDDVEEEVGNWLEPSSRPPITDADNLLANSVGKLRIDNEILEIVDDQDQEKISESQEEVTFEYGETPNAPNAQANYNESSFETPIEDFEIDPNFDYDNIELTQKYSMQEMKEMWLAGKEW